MEKLIRINPISFNITLSPLISYTFNTLLKTDINDMNNYSPILKFGFYGTGTDFTEKMFVSEENENMVTFVRNVILELQKTVIRRSVYMIIRSKISYIHLSTGIIFDDLLDYAIIENEEISNFFEFDYDGTRYSNPSNISYLDENYKLKTKIMIKGTENQFPNDFYTYLLSYPYDNTNSFKNIEFKVAYYIKEQSLGNFHVVNHIALCFCDEDKRQNICSYVISNTNNLQQIIDTNLSKDGLSNNMNNENKTKYIGSSLSVCVKSLSSLQKKQYYISWFFAEVLFELFFNKY